MELNTLTLANDLKRKIDELETMIKTMDTEGYKVATVCLNRIGTVVTILPIDTDHQQVRDRVQAQLDGLKEQFNAL